MKLHGLLTRAGSFSHDKIRTFDVEELLSEDMKLRQCRRGSFLPTDVRSFGVIKKKTPQSINRESNMLSAGEERQRRHPIPKIQEPTLVLIPPGTDELK